MLNTRDEWIMKRAYAIWEEEGYPSGRDTVHWEQACNERTAMEKSAVANIEIGAKPKAKRKAPAGIVAVVGEAAAKAMTKRTSKKAAEAKL
ncbi:MAG: DUF2934 domain-containing protein [Rhizobiaceae bacterium]|nr:DUF2934 domain-containing protein [Rhizobiaceae bacterium]